MKKQVNYKVTGKEWEEAKTKAFTKISKKAKIDGFREGKVPRSVFEKKYGTGDIISAAMEEMVDAKYRDVIISEKIIPVIEPKLEIVTADDNGFEVNMTFILSPEVKLGKYKELKVKKDKVKVTKEEIEHEVSHILDRYAELVSKDGAVEEGDTAIIDFKGFKDGVAFDGGTAENYSLEIGSHTFIPGFEEGVIGMKKEESKDIELAFPEDYGAKELAGQKVVFNVTVHDIKKRFIPNLDEEFFKDLDMEGVTNKEELNKVIEEELVVQKEADIENKFVDDLLTAATRNMTIELDEEIIEAETNRMHDNFVKRLEMQGLNEELYFAYAGIKKEDALKEMSKAAEKRLKESYLLEEIVKVEKIEVTDEEAKEELAKMCTQYKITEEELLKELGSLEALKYDLAMRKAVEVLKENN
ncbi:MAG: trigger factor [Bacilli bacterium]|nr:trigger factor [Bacilli bacterium]